jgi:SAM-dependent methyltransferase
VLEQTVQPPTTNLQNLPFDQYGRYALIREIVDAARPMLGPSLRILDVGGLAVTRRGAMILPAQLFLPADEVSVLDMPPCDLPGYIQGDGRGLHFADAAFDVVISCDALEHVPAADRPAFWGELLRVARHGVILAAPFASPETVAAEALLQRFIRSERGITQPQLAEHSQYGLPERATTSALLASLGYEYRCYPTGYIHAWLVMMLAKHMHQFDDLELHDQLDAYYNLFLGGNERREPAYRYVWAVAKAAHIPWLAAVDAAITPTLGNEAEAPAWRELATWLAQSEALRHSDQQRETISGQQHTISTLHAALAQKDAQIADLERRSTWLAEQATAARNALAAVEQGVVMRLLRRFGRRGVGD